MGADTLTRTQEQQQHREREGERERESQSYIREMETEEKAFKKRKVFKEDLKDLTHKKA